jgi:hypothetical protein
MAEQFSLAQALIQWKAVAADELIEQLASFRSAVAAVSNGDQSTDTAAAATEAGPADSPGAALDPDEFPTAAGAGLVDSQDAGLAPAGIAATLGPDSPPIADLAAATVDAPAPQPSSDAAQMQTELLREQIEISRSLLDLAQGSGIKVDGPEPSWGP